MSDDQTIMYNGLIGLGVLLSRDFMGKEQYRSRFSLPVEPKAFSTERKLVRTGEGRLLQQFLKNPVHTSPISPDRARQASRTLPNWIYKAIERNIVQFGRTHAGYTFELIAIGEPSITWRLKRLVSRRQMRYNPVKLLGAKGKQRLYEKAMERLRDDRPLGFASEADKLTIDHWYRCIHFIMRMTAFDTEADMDAWIARHPRGDAKTEAIDRNGVQPILSDPPAAEKGRFWFETVGWYALPVSLLARMDDEAYSFAFSQPRGMRLFRAYIDRGPDNPVLNFLNWPLEAASLYKQQCPPGTVLTEFTCDLRLEIYK